MATDIAASPLPVATRRHRHDFHARHGHTAHALKNWLAAAVLASIVFACFAGKQIAHLPPAVGGDINGADQPMWSAHHLFGTDPLGNDVLARVLAGGRLSIEVAVASNVLGFVLGGLIGISSGFRGGWLDQVTATVLNVMIAFPALLLALVIAAGLGPGELHLMMALTAFSVPAYARMARASTLKVRLERFVLAAHLAGTRPTRIVLTHIVPNVLPQLLTFSCLGLSATVMLEASLSFLGLGVRPPEPSWGSMILQGQEYLTSRPSLVLVPSAFLTVTLLSLNVLEDAVRQRLARR